MIAAENQGASPQDKSTRLISASMRLASAKRDRLWKGLERVANTGDTLAEYADVAKAWSSFWPVDLRVAPEEGFALLPWETQSLAWQDVCHDLFLVFRDTLRLVWRLDTNAVEGPGVGFLLGIGGEFQSIAHGENVPIPNGREVWRSLVSVGIPGLNRAWDKIKNIFPRVYLASQALAWPDWKSGDFIYYPHNEFQSAMYLLFRESWRARTCARCNIFFIARKPKQQFCGTVCSAGSRLASKRKWWNRIGAKRRASAKAAASNRKRRNRSRK